MLALKLIDNIQKTAIKRTQAMQKQMAFAASKTLNDIGFQAKKSLGDSSNQYFNKPTPFIKRAWLVQKSTKQNLITIVYPMDRAVLYLRANITGGQRGVKPFEAAFRNRSSGLSGSLKFIPLAQRKNTYGNVSRAALAKILNATSTTGDKSVFIGKPLGGNRPPGVYQRRTTRAGSRLVPLFEAKRTATYRPIFPIGTIVHKIVDRRFSTVFATNLSKAIATAR